MSIPPQDIDAERAILGAILTDSDALDGVMEIVRPEDFYRPAHRIAYEAMLRLLTKNEPVDRVTLRAALGASGQLESVGGDDAVLAMWAYTPAAANVAYYAKIVRDKAQRRRLIEAGTAISRLGYEQHGDAAGFADECERRIMDATDRRGVGGGGVLLNRVISETYVQMQADFERGSEITGLPSGLADLDRMTAGFQPGDLVVLAARPSIGKTACGLGWATHVSVRLGRGALFFSMEMLRGALGRRILSAEARVDGQRVRNGQLLDGEWAKLGAVTGEIGAAPLVIDDARGLSALEIRGRARRAAKLLERQGKALSLIVVDYLTLMRIEQTDETISARVGRNARLLKDMAGEMKIPVILLAQLNREPARGSTPRRPVLTDLRDSGEIEQHADVVIFIHAEDADKRELIVEKQRTGPTGVIPVSWHAACARFDNASRPTHWTERADHAER